MLHYRKLKKTISGTFNGKPFNITRTGETEQKMESFSSGQEYVTQDEFFEFVKSTHKQEIAGSNEYLTYNPVTGEYFLKYEGYKSDKPIPPTLVHIIESSYDKDIDFLPVIKMWARVLLNPRLEENKDMVRYLDNYLSTSYVDYEEVSRLIEEEDYTEEVAVNMCTYQDIAITQEGLLATYKVAELVTKEYVVEWDPEANEYIKKQNPKYEKTPPVIDEVTGEILEEAKDILPDHAEDLVFTPAICKYGEKFFSGNKLGYVYKIGEMQYLPEDATRNYDNTSGGGGLYIGGLNYVDHFKKYGKVLTCFVNPSDIISFQSDGHAIRVDALFPNNIWDESLQLRGAYHSSDYAATSEARVKELIAKAVEKTSPVPDMGDIEDIV